MDLSLHNVTIIFSIPDLTIDTHSVVTSALDLIVRHDRSNADDLCRAPVAGALVRPARVALRVGPSSDQIIRLSGPQYLAITLTLSALGDDRERKRKTRSNKDVQHFEIGELSQLRR
jgi:hypothetical protein